MNTRLLGTLGIIGGLAYMVDAVFRTIVPGPLTDFDFPGQLLDIVWAAGAICAWLGFIAIRGTGQNIAVRFLSCLPILGLSLVLVIAVYALINRFVPFSIPLTGVGLALELVGIVLNTIFAIATRALAGWRKFTPLFVLCGVVLGGLITGLTNGSILGLPLCLGFAYAILGYAVQSAAPEPKLIRQPA
jgi:hypothetical protein